MVVEDFLCQTECDTETRPWRCWVDFFKETAGKRPGRDLAPETLA
jgi:hypothetical protein